MAIEHKDRVKDQTSIAGTGSFVLDGVSPTGFVGFLGTFTDGATVAYAIANSTNAQWEVGRGVWTVATKTLTRVPTSSSSGGALVNFSAGAKTIVSGPSAVDFNETATLAGVETLSKKTLVNPTFQGQTLTDAAIIAWDANLGSMAQVTIAGDRRVGPISNMKNGPYWLFVIMGGAGNYKLTWDAMFQFDGGVVPLGSTAVGSVDAYRFVVYNNVAYAERFVKGTSASAPSIANKTVTNNNFILLGDTRMANATQDGSTPAIRRIAAEGVAGYILEGMNHRGVFAGNYGMVSETLANIQGRLAGAASFGTRGNLLTVEPGKSAGIVIFLGGVYDGNTPIGTLSPIYQDIFQRLANAGKLVIVCNELPNNGNAGVVQPHLDRRSYLDNFVLPTNDSRIVHANTFDLLLQSGTTNTGLAGKFWDNIEPNSAGYRMLGELLGGILEPILNFNSYPVRTALPAAQPILSASPAMTGTAGTIATEAAGAGGSNKDGANGVGVTGQVADGYVFFRDDPLKTLLNAAQPVTGSQLSIVLSKGVDSDGFATQKFRITGQIGALNSNYLCSLADEEYLDKPTWAAKSVPDGTKLFVKARIKVAALAKGLFGVGLGGTLTAYPDFQNDSMILSGSLIRESGLDWRGSAAFDKVMVSPVLPVLTGFTASTINRTINSLVEVNLAGGVPIDISIEVSRMSMAAEPGAAAPPPATGGLGYPFGSRLTPYVAGIAVTSASQAAQDNTVRAKYDAWKAGANVAVNTGGPIARCGGWTVAIGDPQYASQAYAFFSESMGYGMLLTVLMAGYDAQAKTIFDGIFTVCRQHPAYNEGGQASDLLDWRSNLSCASAGDGYDAMDGDMDIALALLMADKQWGSAGVINYKQRGINIINALKTYNMHVSGYTMGLPQAQFTRCSDYMMAHFRAYKRATGDVFWDTAYNKCESFNQYVQANFATVTGLIPENLIHCDQAHPDLSPGFTADNNSHEMDYYYNSCRVPWRLACHYLTTGDATTKTILNKMMTWMDTEIGSLGLDGIAPGYKLDGTRIVARGAAGYYRSGAFTGPVTVGMTVDAAHQTQLNKLWLDNVSNTEHGYYDTELSLLSLIAATGNWWNP